MHSLNDLLPSKSNHSKQAEHWKQSTQSHKQNSPEYELQCASWAAEIMAMLKFSMPHIYLAAFPSSSHAVEANKADPARIATMQLARWLAEDGVMQWQIDICHQKLKRCRYLPTTQEILKMCEPDVTELGLPSIDDAFIHAIRQSNPATRSQWSHKAIYNAALAVGSYELKTLSEREIKPKFAAAYLDVVKRLQNGEAMSDPPDESKLIECDKYGERVKSAPAKLKNLMEDL